MLGRLSPEKGVLGLLEAWRHIDYPLTIVGDGPQMSGGSKSRRKPSEVPRKPLS